MVLTASDWLPSSSGAAGRSKGNTHDGGAAVPAVPASRGTSTMLSCGSSRVGFSAPAGQSATVRPAWPSLMPVVAPAGKTAVVASARVPRSYGWTGR